MEFSEIFDEYFSLFRGQAANIPVFGDREFDTGIRYCNSAIKSWERADGMLWRELIDTAASQSLTVLPLAAKTIASNTLSYAAPTNMRKPPAFVRFYSGTNYFDVPTQRPQNAKDYSDTSSIVWFKGGANAGYTMIIGSNLATQYNGWLIDYIYVKKATLLSTTQDPSTTVIEMSDPNYAINKMLYRRYIPAKNGSGIKTADREVGICLINMKIEDSSGTYGNADRLALDSGWGTNGVDARIVLP